MGEGTTSHYEACQLDLLNRLQGSVPGRAPQKGKPKGRTTEALACHATPSLKNAVGEEHIWVAALLLK